MVLIVIFSILVPRVTMLFIAVLTDWFSRAYETSIWPILGWIFLPYTTLAYMSAILNNGHGAGWFFLFAIAFVVDITKLIKGNKET